MNATDTLKRVKAVLGLTVSLEQMKLENGTVIEADSFEAGQSVFIVTEDEKVALPVGEYELENGIKLIIEEEGIIAQIGEEVKEVEEEEAEEVEAEDKEQEMGYVSKEEFITALEEVIAMIEELKADKKEMAEETPIEEVEMSQEEVNEEEVELNAQLSEPATEPLKHAPKEEGKHTPKFKFNKSKNNSAYDKIVEKINNFKKK